MYELYKLNEMIEVPGTINSTRSGEMRRVINGITIRLYVDF